MTDNSLTASDVDVEDIKRVNESVNGLVEE